MPLVVAVTGHRDLVPAEIPHIRARVQDFLRELRERYGDRTIGIMSALAEGADQLVAEEAIELGIPLTVTLPMPARPVRAGFRHGEVRAHFERLCAAAVDVFELPLTPGNTDESIADPGPNRARQYAQVGVFMCAHCHVLLALWDGKDSDQLGGTSQVVRFHHDDVMPGSRRALPRGRLIPGRRRERSRLPHRLLARPARREPGRTASLPSRCAGSRPTIATRASPDMPARHRLVFDRTNEFSRDIRLHAAAIDKERYPLLTPEQATPMPPGLLGHRPAFCAADWLAIHFQKRVQCTLRRDPRLRAAHWPRLPLVHRLQVRLGASSCSCLQRWLSGR